MSRLTLELALTLSVVPRAQERIAMSESVTPPNIIVIGSLNLETLLSVPALAAAGGTVAASAWESRYGGKGANQAIAASRQGANVTLIGCVGDDGSGRAYLSYLSEQGIGVDGLQLMEGVQTGRSYVCVDPVGARTTVTASGANGYLGAQMVLHQHAVIEQGDAVLCQLEVPLEATISALQCAHELGKTTFLNPSPMSHHFPWGQVPVDFLIVNEAESKALLGYEVESTSEAVTIRSQMADLGVGVLIITRGAEPTFVFGPKQALKLPPPPVDVVDRSGAGDAFVGALAAHYVLTRDLFGSVKKANIAGALACTRSGVQDSIPLLGEVEEFGKPAEEAASDKDEAAEAVNGVNPTGREEAVPA